MTGIWHWLVIEGLNKDLVAASVGAAVAHAIAWRPLRALRKRQERIADLLDTKTPGGLGDVARVMQGQPAEPDSSSSERA